MLLFLRPLVVAIALFLPFPVVSSSVMSFPNDTGSNLNAGLADSTQVINIFRGDSIIETLTIDKTGAVTSSGSESENSTFTSAIKITERITGSNFSAASGLIAMGVSGGSSAPLANEELRIHFREIPGFIIIHNRIDTSWNIDDLDTTTSIMLPQGTYDIMTLYQKGSLFGTVIKENVSTGTTVEMGFSDALYSPTMALIDENGAPWKITDGQVRIRHLGSGVGFGVSLSPDFPNKFSSFSQAYSWEWATTDFSNGVIHQFVGAIQGVSHDTIITNRPSDLRKFTYRFNAPPWANGLRTYFYTHTRPWLSFTSGTPYDAFIVQSPRPFLGTAYYMAAPYNDFFWGYTSRLVWDYQTNRTLFESPCIGVNNDGTYSAYVQWEPQPAAYSSPSDTIDIGLGPMFWCGKFCNTTDSMMIRTREWKIQSVFKNPTFDLIPHVGKHYYTLSQNGSTIWTDTLMFQRGWNSVMPVHITPGTYTFTTQCEDYHIDDIQGRTTAALTFTSTLTDRDPPFIKDFHVETQGKRTVHVNDVQPATISVEFWDIAGTVTASAFYRQITETEWNPLPLDGAGLLYTAGPPQLQQNCYIALKIVAQDQSGNEMVCTMDPVYYYNTFNSAPLLSLVNDTSTNEDVPLRFSLSATDPNNDVLTFSATGLPPGASFDPVTATFSWRPGCTQAGFYPGIIFSVSDGKIVVADTFAITVIAVNCPPVLAPIGDKMIIVDSLLQFTVAATDGDGDALTWSASDLPPGATFDSSTATFAWQPASGQSGTYPGIIFSVSDGSVIDVETLTVTVISLNRPPELAAIGNKTIAENTELQFTIAAIDSAGDILTYAATGLPIGASFDPGTATFTWQPSLTQAGTYTGITLTVSDGELTDEETIAVTVTNINQLPVLATIDNKTVSENALLQFTLSATDPDGDSLTYSAINLPTGATFNASTGAFNWQPSFTQAGVYPNLNFIVSDGTLTDTETTTVTVTNVNRLPILATIGNKTVAENSLLQFTLSATDPDGDSLTYSTNNLPAGAVFTASTRTFTWQPTCIQATSYPNIIFGVWDGNGTDLEVINITVTPVNCPPVLATIGNKAVVANSLLQFTVSATDGDGSTLFYSATGLPTGASFNSSNKTFFWYPGSNQVGTFSNVKFTVSDGILTDEETVIITVIPIANLPPVLSPIGNKTVAENSILQFSFIASDPNGTSLTYSATGLPSGATFDPSTRTFNWQPNFSQAGTYPNVKFTVSDGALTDDETITITVTNSNSAPVLAAIGNKTVAENSLLQFTVSATDPDGDSLDYLAFGLPPGAFFDTTTRTFTWRPTFTQAGTYPNVKFIVIDGSLTDSETVTLTVSNTNRAPVLTTIGNKTIPENELLRFTVAAIDEDGDALTYTLTGLPEMANFDASITTFFFFPRFNQAGSYPGITFIVSDGKSADTESVTISVINTDRPPVINLPDNLTFTIAENELIPVPFFATDPDSEALTFSCTNLPAGAFLDPSTGQFTWRPEFNQAGIYSDIRVIASDGTLTAEKTITITVINVNHAPSFEHIGFKTIAENELLEFTVDAIDPDGDALTCTAEGLPAGASFNPSTHVFSWRPDFTQAGFYQDIRIRISDGTDNYEGPAVITVTNVNRPPALEAIGDKSIVENSVLQFTLSASDPDGDHFGFMAGELPPGAMFNRETATFTWRPSFDQAGTYPNVTFAVLGGDTVDEESITITVANANQPPIFAPFGDQSVAEYNLLQFDIYAFDLDGDALTISATSLPSGASFNPSTRTFTWLPDCNQSGTYSDIRFTASDGNLTTDMPIIITVINVNRAPTFKYIGIKTMAENEPLEFTVDAIDPDGDALTCTATGLPASASFDPSTRIFSWRPDFTQAGIYPDIRIIISDGMYNYEETVSITVTNTNQPPVLAAIGDKSVDENSVLQFTLTASDPEGDQFSFMATGLPPGAIFDRETATFTWRPSFDQAGIYPNVIFTVHEGNMVDEESIVITVANTNLPPIFAPFGDKSVAEYNLLQFAIDAHDPDGDTLSFSATGLPSGASFNPSTKTFTWKPDFNQAGTYSDIRFIASDGYLTDNKSITITVSNSNRPPAITGIGNKIVAENELLQFTVAAIDADNDALTYSASGLPVGASFDPVTATFTWQPGFDQAGTYANVKFTASDGELTDEETIAITVTNTNRAPVLAAIGNKTVAEFSWLQFTLAATDDAGDTLTYAATGLPSGATFNASTKTFMWLPTFDQAGSYPEIKFTVSDGTLTNEETITVTVNNTNRPPVSQGSHTIGVFENSLVELTVNASDPDGDALTYSAINLPTGASFDSSTAVFTWQPDFTQAGSYPNIKVIVSDGINSVNVYIRITVANNNRPPVLAYIGNKTSAENNLVQFIVTATDPDGDTLTYSATGLPSGALFDPSTATFTWQPGFDQAGTYANVTFTVSDGELTDEESVSFTVNNVDQSPVLEAISDKTVAENVLLQFSLNATDADGDALTYSATGLPTGATFNTSTRQFSWQPNFTQAGAYTNIKFTVSDGTLTDDETVTVSVTNTDQSPVLAAIGNKTVAENGLLQFTLTATDADGDALSYSATGLPTGATFNTSTRQFSWQPNFTQAGSNPNIKFTVSDGTLTDDETITITITNTNRAPVAVNDAVATSEDGSVLISVKNNDSDPDGNTITVTSVLQPPNGTATINAGNTITYLPRLNYYGTDQFTYTIADGQGGTATANVSITVTSVNDAPTVAITSPANGAIFGRNSNITINATAADVDGTITKVEFYRNGVKMGQDTTSPYSYMWSMATVGTQTLYCKAYDSSGTVKQSASRTITIQ